MKEKERETKYHPSVLGGSFINTKGENCFKRTTKGKQPKEKSNFLCSNYIIECYIFTPSIKDHRCVYICLE